MAENKPNGSFSSPAWARLRVWVCPAEASARRGGEEYAPFAQHFIILYGFQPANFSLGLLDVFFGSHFNYFSPSFLKKIEQSANETPLYPATEPRRGVASCKAYSLA